MNASKHMKKKLLCGVIAASMAAVVAPTATMAQTATATLKGKTTPGAQVTAFNPKTGTTRKATAGADGAYIINGLQPATYQVDAGPGTQQNVTLTVASTATLNLAAASAAPAASAANATTMEGVSVSASTLTEVKTPEVAKTISLRQIQTIPQVSRNFLEFADTVPGMVFSVDAQGHTSLRGGAQNDSSVNVFIDGVGQKSYVKEGGVSGQVNSQGNPFPQLAIGEYKVITSNYKAEYDQVSSAAITAETKSGTNEFHGEVFDTYTSDKYRSRTPSEEDGDKARSFEKEYGFALGGPIIKDQMHFFVTFEQKKFDTPITVSPGSDAPASAIGLLPTAAQNAFGSASLPFDEKLYFGKIDWEFTDRDRIEISTQVRRETQADNIGQGQSVSQSIFTENHDTRGTFRWQHSGDWYFNEFKASYENSSNDPLPVNYANGYNYTWKPANDAAIIGIGAASPLATQIKGQEGPMISDDFTFNDLTWYGDHVVKAGWKYKEVTLHAQDAQDTNPQYTYSVDESGTEAIPYKIQFSNPVPGLNPVSETKDKQYGAYIQDDWSVNDHLTLNIGVRWDKEKTPSYLDWVTPESVINAFNSLDPAAQAQFPGQTYAQTLAKGGIDYNNYISNGSNRHAQNQWAPRLGFSYDLFADEEHVIHGGAGRSYDRNLYDYLQLEQTKSALPYQQININTASHPCVPGQNSCFAWDPAFLNGLPVLQGLVSGTNLGQEVDILNNNLRAPYSDQFSIGMSNKVGDWNTDATITRVLSYDGFAFTLGNRYPDGSFFQNGSQPWNNGIPGFGSMIRGDNGIRTATTQVLLSADKPYTRESGWSANFAYTYSHAKQNRDINEHYSFDYGSIKDYPFITSNAAAKHRFVATGSLDGPWGFTFSGKLIIATPLPWNGFESCGAGCYYSRGESSRPIAGVPAASKFLVGGKIWGYREIDLQATKDFVIDSNDQTKFYVRIDLLNVFNWKNFADYTSNTGAGAVGAPVVYNKDGNITGVPRTAKITAGFKF
ncbi:TonB-dependent receptor [Luteibacter aegosomatissinici]|uniref:TonB-dependent receptor n=1 Tax=Luteibacter aegosomatissinici TaxID=2911539 RepID=UPI001FF84EA6|nr:TonB-dependent receptor [Luteibacter aegosomatissinici]UPG94462.1 TonB-dependent receptor [Luteibacter aegosomatissinici]